MEYYVNGPYKIPTKNVAKGKTLDLENKGLRQFWKTVETDEQGVSSACGCYVYAIRAGRGFTPWYIGQAKKGFGKEVLSDRNVKKFTAHYLTIAKGTPVIFLISRLTNSGNRWVKNLDKNEADRVENYLIHLGLYANKGLLNVQKTKFYREVILPGIHNSKPGQQTQSTRDLAKAFCR